jgi:hypothetical protein
MGQETTFILAYRKGKQTVPEPKNVQVKKGEEELLSFVLDSASIQNILSPSLIFGTIQQISKTTGIKANKLNDRRATETTYLETMQQRQTPQ